MSNYTDFAIDFPERCGDILREGFKVASRLDREVTLLLMTAAAAFVIPFERLEPSRAHPSRDYANFGKTSRKLARALDRPYDTSELYLEGPGSWSFGDTGSLAVDPDQWPGFPAEPPSGTRLREMLTRLRNGLAHGNLYVRAKRQDEIDLLVFVSEVRDGDRQCTGYGYFALPPESLHALLKSWLAFLEKYRISQSAAAGALRAAV